MQILQIANDAAMDSAFALRLFRRSPGWTFVTLLTIALGVGASTAVFSVADTFLIRPLAYRDASRVYAVSIQGTIPGETLLLPISAAAVREWRKSSHAIEAAAAYGGAPSALLHGDLDDVSATTAIVDTGFLAFTGARPVIGRNFAADETVPDGPRAIMLAEGFWRRQFGGSSDVIGKVVRLEVGRVADSRPSTIVGVMPASVSLPDFKFERPDVWLPLVDGQRPPIGVAVRLKPGLSPDAASEELTAILRHAGIDLDPGFKVSDLRPRIRLSRPQDDLPFRQALIMLTGAVILLLLIACSNVSHLLVQRGVARERELAARHALGAHRARLVRQLVMESTLLGLAGGALAMLVGWGALTVLVRLRPASLSPLTYLSTTHGVIPLAAGLAIAVGLTVGVLGALHVVHKDLGQSLRTGASSAPLTQRKLRGTLVIGQIALSAILLTGAILLTRAVIDLERVRLGFDARDLYAVAFRGDPNRLAADTTINVFAREVRGMAERVLGPRDLTIAATALPGGMSLPSAFETREHQGTAGSSGFTWVNYVAPDYFTTMRMPLIAGRTFDEGSLATGEVIVSRSLAQQLWHDDDVVGRQFRNSRPEGGFQQWHTVVGVAPDILINRLAPTQPMLFQPFPGGAPGTTLLVRLPRRDAQDLLRRFAKSVQPNQSGWRIIDMNQRVEQSIAEPRFTMSVLVLFAASGVLLAAIGLFGVLSYSLGVRTREIGVRITLGATRGNIAGLFVRDALGQAALGTAIGLAGAAGAAQLIGKSFYGVHSFDSTTFILAGASMLVVSVAACAGPLFRATMVDPAVALRAD